MSKNSPCLSCMHKNVYEPLTKCFVCNFSGIECKNFEMYKPKPQTNADRIRSMTDAELTRFFAENCGCGEWCMHNRSGACARKDEYSCCLDVWHDWLKAPVEVEE